jgi:predicted N-formylglutamate amidohydrolase
MSNTGAAYGKRRRASLSSAAMTGLSEPAVETLAGDHGCGLLLLCDHAANGMPAGYGDLGLGAAELRRHIAYDIGAAAVTRGLAAALGAPAVLSRFSRLLIDLNRGEDDPTLVMRLSDGAVVPGNRGVDAAERERRVARYFRPYHAMVEAFVEKGLASGTAPAILSVHSFTPAWKGVPRPWHAGLLWDRDDRLAAPLIAALSAEPGMVVGDNEPYSGALKNDTLYRHATMRGLAHAVLEIRQDLVGDDAGVAGWVARLARIMKTINADPILHEVRHYGSRAE